MSDQKASQGRYLYAVIAGSGPRDYGPLGINDGTVYTLVDEELAAVVSDVPNRRIRPERRFLAAHNAVLQILMKETTPLPLSFGVIADGPEAVPGILSRNHKTLVDQLQRVRDKVEMGLRVSWNVPNVFEYLVNTHPELRTARDRFFGTHREPSHEDKIELGRMFDRLLTEDREEHSGRVENILSGSSFEIKRNRCRNEHEVMNLACLIGRDHQADFEEAVFAAASLFNNDYTFDFNGPWAPHNFVDIELQL
jgi:hypothetical protein